MRENHPGLTYSEERGQYESAGVREYHEIRHLGCVQEDVTFALLGREKVNRLVSKGLLQPAGYDSKDRPFFNQFDVSHHSQFHNADIPGSGCCQCCGHCQEDDRPSASTRTGKPMRTIKSMQNDTEYDYSDDVEYIPSTRLLSARVEREFNSLKWLFRSCTETLSPRVEHLHGKMMTAAVRCYELHRRS